MEIQTSGRFKRKIDISTANPPYNQSSGFQLEIGGIAVFPQSVNLSFHFLRQVDLQGILDRSQRSAYFAAMSLTSVINPEFNVMGLSPKSKKH